MYLCVWVARGSDEKELLTAGVTVVKKADAEEEEDKDDKNIFSSLSVFCACGQPCGLLCPKLWKRDG